MAPTEPLVSIRESEQKLEIVNQLLLPHAIEYLEIDSIEAAHDAIKSMKVGIIYSSFHDNLIICCDRFVVHQQ